MAHEYRQELQDLVLQMRDSMAPGEFRDYIMGFMLYRLLSERMERHADRILEKHGTRFSDLRMASNKNRHILDALKKDAIKNLGYYIGPARIFNTVATRGTQPGAGFLAELTGILIEMNPVLEQDIEARLKKPILTKVKNTETYTNRIIDGIMEYLALIAAQT